MSIFELLLIALGLAMDAFAVSVCKGLAVPSYRLKYSCLCGLWFGSFQALMPAAGYLLGVSFKSSIEAFDHWFAFVLLGLIGFNMVREALNKDDEKGEPSFSAASMAVLAAATSIDALAVGVTLAFLSVDIFTAAAIIGILAFVISALGVKIGAVFGTRYKSKAEIAGGIILLIMGVKILIDHLMK